MPPDPAEIKEQGRFEGMVIQKLDDLKTGQEEIKEDSKLFKIDIYKKVTKNTTEIARQKGWMAGIAMAAGIVGGFIKGLIFRQ